MNGPRFLDPVVLARIENLELLAKTVVEGFVSGLHRSPYLGFSIDFAEHRAYMPGDDIRRVDWKLYGRTDRFYVKEFEADTNANVMTLLDVSRSMSYSSGGVSKLDYGRYLAACLTYFSRQQRDRVGLATFDSDLIEYIPPSARQLENVLHTLDRLEPGETSRLDLPLLKAAEAQDRRGIVVLISDFYEEPARVVEAVSPLGGKGSDVIVFHVLDPAEIEFPFDKPVHFEDIESGERIPVVPEKLRERYRELITAHIDELKDLMTESRIDYELARTDQPLDFALFTYLSRRQKLARVR